MKEYLSALTAAIFVATVITLVYAPQLTLFAIPAVVAVGVFGLYKKHGHKGKG